MRTDRVLALLTAVTAWAALALQLLLIVRQMTADGASVGEAMWRFFGFFTILGNCAVAMVSTALASGSTSRLAGARARLATVTAIALIGLVYSIALRWVWEPTGWQAIADHALHDATPPLFILTWLLSRHDGLKWRDAVWGVLPALAYFAYAMARGAADGWYAYWFLNPATQSVPEVAVSIIVLLAAFLAVSLVFVALDRWLARRRKR